MNKGELISKIASEAGINKTQAAAALNSALSGIGECLKGGDKLALIGFGTFSVSKREARVTIKPGSKTKERITIPARNVVKFKPGKDLSDSVN